METVKTVTASDFGIFFVSILLPNQNEAVRVWASRRRERSPTHFESDMT
jgi:hypothetical protein